MLKQPENVILNDFKQQRAAALDPQLIGQYEELVTDWMNTIETTLNDTSDERFVIFSYLLDLNIHNLPLPFPKESAFVNIWKQVLYIQI